MNSVENCGVFAVCLCCVCDVFAVCLRCVCGAFAVCLLCICGVFAVCLRCVCVVFATCLQYVCGMFSCLNWVYRSPRKHLGGSMSHPGSIRDTQERPREAPRRHPGGIRRHHAPIGHLAGMGEPKCFKSVIPSSKTRWSTFPGRIHTHLECTPWNH